MMNKLLGHLAVRLGRHQEVWATEALFFIVNSSAAARRAFLEYARELADVDLPSDLWFRTQTEAKDGSIPDLVAVDDQNRLALVIEAKFWAGLTDNQPVAYLNQVAAESSSLLLFIAPATRLNTLWTEVLGRCRDAGLVPELIEVQGSAYVAQVADRTLALCGWDDLLTYITLRLELAGEHAIANDVRQLAGLCAQMDQAAFQPVRAEELAPEIGKRNTQYCDLVDDLTEQLRHEKIASLRGLRATGTKYWYGRYMTIFGFSCLLKCDHMLWSSVYETPIWFRVSDVPDARRRLTPLEMEIPPRMIRQDNELLMPLRIPLGVEHSVVSASLMTQIKEIIQILHPDAKLF